MDSQIPSVRPRTEQQEELIEVLERQDGFEVAAAAGGGRNQFINVEMDDDARWGERHTKMALRRGFIMSAMRDRDGGEVQLRNLRMTAGRR